MSAVSVEIPIGDAIRAAVDSVQKILNKETELKVDAQNPGAGAAAAQLSIYHSAIFEWPAVKVDQWIAAQIKNPIFQNCPQGMLDQVACFQTDVDAAKRAGANISEGQTIMKHFVFSKGEGTAHLASWLFLSSKQAGYLRVGFSFCAANFSLAPDTVVITRTTKTFLRTKIEQHVEHISKALTAQAVSDVLDLLSRGQANEWQHRIEAAEQAAIPSGRLMLERFDEDAAGSERDILLKKMAEDKWGELFTCKQL